MRIGLVWGAWGWALLFGGSGTWRGASALASPGSRCPRVAPRLLSRTTSGEGQAPTSTRAGRATRESCAHVCLGGKSRCPPPQLARSLARKVVAEVAEASLGRGVLVVASSCFGRLGLEPPLSALSCQGGRSHHRSWPCQIDEFCTHQ